MKVTSKYIFVLWVSFLSIASCGLAQNEEDRVLTTVGTSINDDLGRSWSYLLWTSNNQQLLRDEPYAVFRKTGEADAVSDYELRSVVALQRDELTIRALLNRSLNLGQDLVLLNDTLDGLFGGIIDFGAFDDNIDGLAAVLSRKLAIVISGAELDEGIYQDLLFLARVHPGVSLCLGHAFSELVGTDTTYTYEIRACPEIIDDPLTECARVIGRVTITGGSWVRLAAPGQPHAVAVANQQGDLNVRLRWATPDALRERLLLHFGYHLYRVPKDFAEDGAQDFDDVPPQPGQLAELAALPDAVVKRVNRVPVLPDYLLDEDEAQNLDESVYFVFDDNARFEEGGVPFVDGAEYYYFAVARDVLNREGAYSAGTLVKICDRMAPPTPRRVEGRSVYDPVLERQVIELSFLQNDNSGVEQTGKYHIYRWEDRTDVNIQNDEPNRVATINHIQGAERLRFFDKGEGAPHEPGIIHWYTIRAEDSSSCGPPGNLSGHTGPIGAAIRNYEPLPAPTGDVFINCISPFVKPLVEGDTTLPVTPDLDPELYHLSLECEKKEAAEEFEWVEFWLGNKDEPTILLARSAFINDAPSVNVQTHFPYEEVNTANRTIYARVGAHGKVSEFSTPSSELPLFPEDKIHFRLFEADLIIDRVPADGECDLHYIGDPPEVVFDLDGASSYKIYLRVDDGDLQLMAQGVRGDIDSVVVSIDTLPYYAEEICFYLQVFDADGNPSPLQLLACIGVVSDVPLPTPILAAPEAVGTPSAPQVSLEWFCPTPGVDRFRVYVATAGDETVIQPGNFPDFQQLAAINQPSPDGAFNETFYIFDTGRVEGSFPPIDEALFKANGVVTLGRTYIYYVRAVGHNSNVGPVSNPQTFRWRSTENQYSACVAPLTWPHEVLHSGLLELQLQAALGDGDPADSRILLKQMDNALPSHKGAVVIRIGEYLWDVEKTPLPTDLKYPIQLIPLTGTKELNAWIIPGTDDPIGLLYEPDFFPCVLYRVQLPGDLYSQTGLDLHQVSPMMERIAHEVRGLGDERFLPGDNEVVILDPFTPMVLAGREGDTVSELYLLDTQPVIRGATYQYLLVHFNERKEIRRLRSLGTLTIE